MIRNVAALLQDLLNEHLPQLDASDVKHAPTIGDMYEGLAASLLHGALAADLGLRIVKGFATDGSTLSDQIDSMLVMGSGERIPMTESYKWHVKDIIAVFEVKKTLLKGELHEAIENLATVRPLEQRWRNTAAEANPNELLDLRSADRAFARIFGRVAPPMSQQGSLSRHERMVRDVLHHEQLSILRIVIGLHGYETETGFRQGMSSILGERLNTPGYGPHGLPQLIISGGFALVKANGQPYTCPSNGNGWPFMFSTPVNPLIVLLEVIWTKLDRMFGLGNVWGEDLEVEVARVLFLGEGVEDGENLAGPSPKSIRRRGSWRVCRRRRTGHPPF